MESFAQAGAEQLLAGVDGETRGSAAERAERAARARREANAQRREAMRALTSAEPAGLMSVEEEDEIRNLVRARKDPGRAEREAGEAAQKIREVEKEDPHMARQYRDQFAETVRAALARVRAELGEKWKDHPPQFVWDGQARKRAAALSAALSDSPASV